MKDKCSYCNNEYDYTQKVLLKGEYDYTKKVMTKSRIIYSYRCDKCRLTWTKESDAVAEW